MLVRSLPSGTIDTAVLFCHPPTHTQTHTRIRLLNYRVFLQENWVLNLLKPSQWVRAGLIDPKPALTWLTTCEQTRRGSEQKVSNVCSKWRQQSWIMPVYLDKDTAIGPGARTASLSEGRRARRRGHQGGKWSQEEMKWTRLGHLFHLQL